MINCDNLNCYEEGLICVPTINQPRIVIVGGGFAGLKLAKAYLKNLFKWFSLIRIIIINSFLYCIKLQPVE